MFWSALFSKNAFSMLNNSYRSDASSSCILWESPTQSYIYRFSFSWDPSMIRDKFIGMARSLGSTPFQWVYFEEAPQTATFLNTHWYYLCLSLTVSMGVQNDGSFRGACVIRRGYLGVLRMYLIHVFSVFIYKHLSYQSAPWHASKHASLPMLARGDQPRDNVLCTV